MDATNNYDDTVCLLCGSGENENVLLLCDGCDKGLHTYCMNLPTVPVGAWYCPGCRRTNANKSEETAGLSDDNTKGSLYPGLGVFFYERVSSKGQNDPEHGRVGMDTQNNILLEFALKNGLVVRSTSREVHSARDPSKLVELKNICKTIKTGECVVVYSVSRFSRNLAQGREMVEAIHQAGGWVYSVTDDITSYDEQFLHLLKDAQAESDQLSQKMRDAFERIRRHGGHIGPAPYGWTTYHDDAGIRRLMVDAEEQQLLVTLRQTHELSQNAVQTAAILNETGLTRRGKAWTSTQVVKCLGSLANNTFSKDLRGALSEI